MDYQPDTPFDNIESAQQFVQLLGEAIEEARREVEADSAQEHPARQLQALQLVSYKLARLSDHINASYRLLNDLRTLRRLLMGERTHEADEEPPEQSQTALLG
jgi:hypothetical protein